MNGLKVAVIGLVVVVAGLLLTIRHLANRPAQQAASAPAVQAPPAAAPAPSAPAPSVEPAVPPEPSKPSPVAGRRALTRPHTSTPLARPETPLSTKPAETANAAAQSAAAAPAPVPVAEAPSAPPPPPAPRHVTLAAGTRLVVRTQNTLSTERNLKGDTFTATLEEPITVEGFVIAERGAQVEGVVTRSQRAGRVEGTSDLAVELVRLHTSDGQKLSIATGLHEVAGERSRGSDAKKIGVATGIGAIIGAIAGGGKGAAIGAGTGAGAGTGVVLATRGKPTVIPSESVLTFQVRTPVEITERR